MNSIDKTDILRAVCERLTLGRPRDAEAQLDEAYPFVPVQPIHRRYSPRQAVSVFARDGFIDRYSGDRLVFVPALRLISILLPAKFPYQANWRMAATHPAYWDLSATIDHILPVARGGMDDDSNWVTTSMRRNSLKLNSTPDELGWSLHPPGSLQTWDGLLNWFLETAETHPELVHAAGLKHWVRAASSALRTST